jgi:general secretion pathway protein D
MLKRLLVLGLGAALAGCYQPMKPTASGHLGEQPPAPAASIPPPVQSLPVPPRPKPTSKAETYGVVVNNVNVRELLFALARDAKVNVDIHPGITGTVTLNAIDQTLPQLLSRISKQVDMRYELDGPNLAVMPDSPYLRIYRIDYVNIARDTKGELSVSSEIVGQSVTGGAGGGSAGAGGGGGGAGQNSSRVSVQNSSLNKFWETLEKNVREILQETDKVLPGGTGPGVPTPAAAAVPPPPAGAQAPGAGGSAAVPAVGPNVTFREASSVIANREAGLLTIRASARQHEKVQEFLDLALVSARRQVLIEATIVEVRLSNQYQQGIDWGLFTGGWQLFQGGLYRNAVQALVPPPVPVAGGLTAVPTASSFVGQYNSNTLRISLQLLETFGTVRVLSSPRISAINNQTAVLKVVENVVYFNVASQTSQAQTTALTTVTTTPQTVPVGIILNVTPQVSENDTVLLNVKPSISRIAARVRDPNPLLTIPNEIPQIAIREMESVIKLSSGQIAVMGGLISDELQDNSDTIPGVNRIPFVGDFFSNKNIQNVKSELVIFMRPLVIRDPSVDGDYRGYRVFLPGEDFMSQPNPGGPRRCEFPGIEGCPK